MPWWRQPSTCNVQKVWERQEVLFCDALELVALAQWPRRIFSNPLNDLDGSTTEGIYALNIQWGEQRYNLYMQRQMDQIHAYINYFLWGGHEHLWKIAQESGNLQRCLL